MLKGIVVVESPAKAQTLGAYLGNDYKVIASYGHIRDLVSKDGSVDPNNHYKMRWEFNGRGRKQLKEISDSLKLSQNLFLATDPDREGEAISWHILEALNEKKLLANKTIQRVVFHEITKTAVAHAFETPKQLDQSLVEAYLARRILDYLVGFSLSPVLWRKMPGAKSAGRVQSVALRLIVERELEIRAFKPEEYWTITADFNAENGNFSANLTHLEGKKLEKLDIKNEESANKIKNNLNSKNYKIDKIEKKNVKRNPYAPFTTSTLQQDSVRKLGFSAKKTMQIAQKLYEGVSIDGAMSGLITYMRTDSTNLSSEALAGAREYIEKTFGSNYLPKSPKIYKTKTKNAQEAHEAIRPTTFSRPPDSLRHVLSPDELSLYELIWRRSVACQMENAQISQVSVDVLSDDKKAQFRATGSTITFDGFLKLYVESTDDSKDEQKTKKLPVLNEGENLDVLKILDEQHFTCPPPRFNEASLVKKLEELGIGRPSTYATIINVLQERHYVTLNKKVFIPDSIGFLVVSFLRNFFSKYVQYGFTAELEEELDEISNGKLHWEKVLDEFWTEFSNNIDNAMALTITDVINTVELDINEYVFNGIDESRKCPLCKTGKINLKLGRYGAFLGCSNYPECRFTKKIGMTQESEDVNSNAHTADKIQLGQDKNNNNDVVFLKHGPYGYYLEWEKTKDIRDPKKKKPKRLSVSKFVPAPMELTIDDVMTLDSLPKILGKHPTSGSDIIIALGRFGPYLKINEKTIKIDRGVNFLKMTLEDAIKTIDSSTI